MVIRKNHSLCSKINILHANDHYNISYYVLMRNIHFIATALINHETLDAFQMMRKRILIFINNRIEKMKRHFCKIVCSMYMVLKNQPEFIVDVCTLYLVK